MHSSVSRRLLRLERLALIPVARPPVRELAGRAAVVRLLAARATLQLGARGREGEARAADERSRGREAEAAEIIDGRVKASCSCEHVKSNCLIDIGDKAAAAPLVHASKRHLGPREALCGSQAIPLDSVRV